MLPHLSVPTVGIGPVSVGTFGITSALAVVLCYAIVTRRAPRIGVARAQASRLMWIAIFWGLIGSHVLDIVLYEPGRLLREPWVLFELWGTLSSFGGLLAGIGALLVAMRRSRMSRREMAVFLDGVLFAFPFTMAVGRIGCALIHDHPGIRSRHWLAVAFPDGPRFDLGVLELLVTGGMAALFVALDRRPRPVGFFTGLCLALYGPLRFGMDALRVADTRYLGWTPGQYLSVLATAVGIVFLARAVRDPEAPSQ